MRQSRCGATVALVLVLAVSRGARAEFRVNDDPSHLLAGPAVRTDASGNAFVVWTDNGGGGGTARILGRRFAPTGVPLGSVVVATEMPGQSGNPPAAPNLAMNASGDAVVIWSRYDGSGYGIWARRYDAAGMPLGAEFPVNTATVGSQFGASAAIDATGNFVVVWSNFGADPVDSADDSVQARRFDATGAPLGAEFQANATGVESPNVDVALATDGTFVVVWDRFDDGLGFVVGQARRFDASGAPLTGDIELGAAYQPRVAIDPGGGFVAAWSGSSGVFLRGFDAAGTATGPAVSVNDGPGVHQSPAVAVQPTGELVVVWAEELPDSEGALGKLGRTLGRRFDAGGVPGPQFVLSSATTARRLTPSLAVLPADGYFAVWTDARGERGDVTALLWRPVQPVRNAKIAIRDNADATKRKIVFQARDPQITTRPTVGIEATTAGMTLHVFNDQGSGDSACLALPAGASWLTSGTMLDPVFVYRDSVYANGPCRTARVKPGQIKVTCQATVQPILYSLDEPAQGAVGVSVRSADVTYCTTFGGTITRDTLLSFKAKRADAPATCSSPPVSCP